MDPLFSPPPTTQGTFFVAGATCLGFGYAFARHPRRMVVWRHPLTAADADRVDGTTAAVYQAVGFLLSVFGATLSTLLVLASTGLPTRLTGAAGAVVFAAGLALARADTRRRQRAGVATVVAGLGLLAGGAFVALAG